MKGDPSISGRRLRMTIPLLEVGCFLGLLIAVPGIAGLGEHVLRPRGYMDT